MKTAFLFPGQGSQYVGMCRDLFDKYDEVKKIFQTADRVLAFPLTDLIFNGKEEDLQLTYNAQPAILTASVACAKLLEERGIFCDVAAGHSLGEYSALVATGVVSFEDTVLSVRQRGHFMQEAVPVGKGSMVAVMGLSGENISKICKEIEEKEKQIVETVNFNCPEQIVIAGTVEGVEKAATALKAAGAKRVLKLPVSAPFHSSLMRPAAERLADVINSVKFSDAKVPVYANVTAKTVQDKEEIKKLLVKQAASPVLWQQSIENMLKDKVDTFVEVGPGRVLCGFLKRIAKDVNILHVEDEESLAETVKFLKGAKA